MACQLDGCPVNTLIILVLSCKIHFTLPINFIQFCELHYSIFLLNNVVKYIFQSTLNPDAAEFVPGPRSLNASVVVASSS